MRAAVLKTIIASILLDMTLYNLLRTVYLMILLSEKQALQQLHSICLANSKGEAKSLNLYCAHDRFAEFLPSAGCSPQTMGGRIIYSILPYIIG